MYCPSCGKKLHKDRIESKDYKAFREDSIFYQCIECEIEWVSLFDSFDQETIIKKSKDI